MRGADYCRLDHKIEDGASYPGLKIAPLQSSYLKVTPSPTSRSTASFPPFAPILSATSFRMATRNREINIIVRQDATASKQKATYGSGNNGKGAAESLRALLS